MKRWARREGHYPRRRLGLLEELSKIEALFAGATSAGERVAAGEARRRILAQLSAPARARGGELEEWDMKDLSLQPTD